MNIENKNIFYTHDIEKNKDKEKDEYYKIIERKQRYICMENKTQSEYIKYLYSVLDQNNIKYYKVNIV